MSAPLYMTGPELRALRLDAGLSLYALGFALGLADDDAAALPVRTNQAYRRAISRAARLEKRGIRADVRDEGLRARVDALRANLPGKPE